MSFYKFPIYQPARIRWCATYCDVGLSAASALVSYQGIVYRMNSIRDPLAHVGAGQKSVFGFSVMAQLYGIYRVYKMQIQNRSRYIDMDTSVENRDAALEAQILYLEVGKTWSLQGGSRAIDDSITDRLTGNTGGLTNLVGGVTQGYPSAHAALTCNGARYPGSIKTTWMKPSTRDGNNGRRIYYRVAATYDVWRFSDQAQSFKNWIADDGYESLMTDDPQKGAFVGTGIVNSSGSAGIPDHQAEIKIKYYTILSRVVKPALTTDTDAFDPAVQPIEDDLMQRQTS